MAYTDKTDKQGKKGIKTAVSCKYDKPRVFIVIAAYNESKRIAKVVHSLKAEGYHNIVVVDDGSKDNTYSQAVSAGSTVIRHRINRGQGAALKTGIDFALLSKADYIVTFDADDQHSPKDLPAMLAPVMSGKYDVALGSRFLSDSKNSKIPFGRKILLKAGVIVQRIFYGARLTDVHNGFRVFSRKTAKLIQIKSNRMEHASEIVEEIVKKKLKYAEVPVRIRYDEYSMSHGHGSFFGALKVFGKMLVKKLAE